MTDPLDLTTVQELTDKATPLPWYANVDDLVGGWCVQNVDLSASQVNRETTPHARYIADFVMTEDDAAFIAAARSLVPALVAELREAREQLATANAKIIELEESRGAERLIHRIQEDGLRQEYDKAPRWEDDPIVIENGWLSGRCARCGEALPRPVDVASEPTETARQRWFRLLHEAQEREHGFYTAERTASEPPNPPDQTGTQEYRIETRVEPGWHMIRVADGEATIDPLADLNRQPE